MSFSLLIVPCAGIEGAVGVDAAACAAEAVLPSATSDDAAVAEFSLGGVSLP